MPSLRRAAGWISLITLMGGALAIPEIFRGNLPLYEAIDEGDEAAVASLLAGGADPNSQSSGLAWLGLWKWERLPSSLADPPLYHAIERKQERIAARLLDAGAKANAGGSNGEPILLAAVRLGSPSLVRGLLAKGANPHGRDRHGATALHEAPLPMPIPLSHGRTRAEPRRLSPEMAEVLRRAGAL